MTFVADAIAGITVAIVALPLAIAFGISSGMGAEAGITTAIIAGFVAAVFGGSNYQVSGPTGAMVVVLAPLVATDGKAAVLFVGFGAGLILIIASILKIGHHVHKLPTSLVEGFTAGIAVVIAMSQLPELSESTAALVTGLVTALGIYLAAHFLPKLPTSLAAVIIVTVINQFGLNLKTVGDLPTNLFNFDLGFFNQSNYLNLVIPIFSVAALAALESLLSARVADRMAANGSEHNADKELRGQGLANLASTLFGGMPATAALARTAVNVRSGAKTRAAAAIHAVVLAVVVLAFAPLFSQIPLAALAGVLVATAAHMIKPSELLKTAKASPLDAIVLVITLLATIFTNLTTAVIIGGIIWFALRKTRLKTTEPPVDQDETLGD
ncbi:MAG: SulP family inorganic anion transporter [Micrococcales bacterium]